MPPGEMTLSVRTDGAYTPRIKLTAAATVQFLGPPLDLTPAHLRSLVDLFATTVLLMQAVGFTGIRIEA